MCWAPGDSESRAPAHREGTELTPGSGQRTCTPRALWRRAYAQGTKVGWSCSQKEPEKNRSHQRWRPGRVGLERSWRPVGM